MEIEEFKKEMKKHLTDFNIELDENQIEKFYKYMNLLIDWNKKINLTAITEPKEIIIKHFVDSLTINKYIKDNSKIIDVGTGAGFPGIPLVILRKDIKITLLDSLNKRINFLNEVIKELNLGNIETIHGRAEELGRNIKYREKYDIATSRAVANISTLSEYLIPFVKIDGKIIFMKGSDVEEELNRGKYAIGVLGGEIIKQERFVLPKTDVERNIVIVKKLIKTSSKYPRKPGMPSKEPLTKK